MTLVRLRKRENGADTSKGRSFQTANELRGSFGRFFEESLMFWCFLPTCWGDTPMPAGKKKRARWARVPKMPNKKRKSIRSRQEAILNYSSTFSVCWPAGQCTCPADHQGFGTWEGCRSWRHAQCRCDAQCGCHAQLGEAQMVPTGLGGKVCKAGDSHPLFCFDLLLCGASSFEGTKL